MAVLVGNGDELGGQLPSDGAGGFHQNDRVSTGGDRQGGGAPAHATPHDQDIGEVSEGFLLHRTARRRSMSRTRSDSNGNGGIGVAMANARRAARALIAPLYRASSKGMAEPEGIG